MDYHGNPISSGSGFPNPAEEELNMGNFKITHVGQPTATGDVVGYGQNAQFSTLSMNGQWNIPNYNPSTPNDGTAYYLSAQGKLVYVQPFPPYGGTPDENQLRIDLSRQTGIITVYLNPVSSGWQNANTMCEQMKTMFNSLTIGGTTGVVTCQDMYVDPVTNKFTISLNNSQAGVLPWGTTYEVRSIGAGSFAYDVLGVTSFILANYGTVRTAATAMSFTSKTDWFAGAASGGGGGGGGGPYNYSLAEDKWWTTQTLYSPDYLSAFVCSDSAFTITKAAQSRLDVNATTSLLTSPLGLASGSFVRIYDSQVDIRTNANQSSLYLTGTTFEATVNTKTRIQLSSTGTTIWSPNLTGSLLLSDTVLSYYLSGKLRINLTTTDLGLYSPSLLNILRVNDNNITAYFNSASRLAIAAANTVLTSPGGTKSITLDDAGISIAGDIYMPSPGGTLYAKTITAEDGDLILYATTTTGPDLAYFVLRPNQATISTLGTLRVDVNTFGTSIYAIAQRGALHLLDDTFELLLRDPANSAASTQRMYLDGTSTIINSPNNLSNLTLTNTAFTFTQGPLQKISVGSSGTVIFGPNSACSLALTNNNITMSMPAGYLAECTLDLFRSRDINGATRLSLNNIGSRLAAPTFASHYLDVNNTDISVVRNAVTRMSIDANQTYMYSPTQAMLTRLTDAYHSVTSAANTIAVTLTPTDYTMFLSGTRIHIDNTHTQLWSPNGLQLLEVNDTAGVRINTGGSNFYDLPKTRGSSGQILSITGSNCSWINSPATAMTNAGTLGTTLLASPSSTKGLSVSGALTMTTSSTEIQIALSTTPTFTSVSTGFIDSTVGLSIGTGSTLSMQLGQIGHTINLAGNVSVNGDAGSAGQVLTSNGTTCTWATPTAGSAINSGWGFMPMSMISATATAATRSFYYISMVPMNTVINGVKAYINAPGSDFINCAIYRGKNMVAGSTLVMTSGRVTVASVCDANNYMTLPMTLQSGQSRTFSAGEYVTICYHSSGATLVMYICPAAPANLGISYISTACYAAAGTPTFPANLSLITASTTNTIRTHMEFY